MNTNKTLLGLIVVVAVLGAIFYFRSPKKTEPTAQDNQQQTSGNQVTDNSNNSNSSMDTTTPVPDSAVATVETSLGSFEITLNGKAAPKTVGNFIKLANSGFYKNLIFHRIVKEEGFHLIQGGDPAGNGTGGPGYTVPAEIGLKHTKGAIAMARLGDDVNPNKDSSGSQFYIVEEDIPFLDGNYTVFGYVTSGMDVVQKIGAVSTDANDKPTTDVVIKNVTIK